MIVNKSANNQVAVEELQPIHSFWINKLQGVNTLQLPKDPVKDEKVDSVVDKVTFSLDINLLEDIAKGIPAQFPSPLLVLLSALKVLLYRYSGQNDICIGTTMHLQDNHHIINSNNGGKYLDVFPLRSALEGSLILGDLVQELNSSLDEISAYSQISVDQLISSLNLNDEKDLSFLFPVIFDYKKATVKYNEEQQLKTIFQNYSSTLLFCFTESGDAIEGSISFNPEIFRFGTIHRMVSHFSTLLQSIHTNPSLNIGLLNLIPNEEKIYLVETLNATQTPFPDKTILELFEEQANKTPDTIALNFKGREISYKELNELSNKLAHYLIANYNLKNHDLVGIKLERSERMIVSVLGALKTGSAYVPIDLDYPEDRIAYMEQDSNCKVLIDEKEWDAFVSQTTLYDVEKPNVEIGPKDAMYVIYTSGSTGNPKGCVLNYEGVSNYLNWTLEYSRGIDYNEVDLFSSLSFDFTVTPFFGALTQGKTLRIYDQSEDLISQLKQIVLNPESGWIKLTPAHISLIDAQTLKDARSKVFVLGGEALTTEQIRHLRNNAGCRIYNEYGPTEATVGCIVNEVSDNNETYIGKPIQNTETYLLDANQQLVPFGSVGEICIGGIGLARGYLNREELTQKKVY